MNFYDSAAQTFNLSWQLQLFVLGANVHRFINDPWALM